MDDRDHADTLIPMPVNEPGEYLDSSDLAYLGDVLDPELRKALLVEFALRRAKSAARESHTDFPPAIEEHQG